MQERIVNSGGHFISSETFFSKLLINGIVGVHSGTLAFEKNLGKMRNTSPWTMEIAFRMA